jgi:hypothetical protein
MKRRKPKLRVIIGDMDEKRMAKKYRQEVAVFRKAEARVQVARVVRMDRWKELMEYRARLDDWAWLE